MNNQTQQTTDVATAAARAVVLGIAVLMFAAIWQSDQSHANEQTVAGHSRRSRFFARDCNSGTFTVSVPSGHGSTIGLARTDSRLERRDRRSSRLAAVARHVSPQTGTAALPEGISSGTYRVVDSLGSVATLRVTADKASVRDGQSERSQYIVETDGVTRYFIRIQPAVVAEIPGERKTF